MYEEMAGKTTFSARKALVEALQASGEMIGDAKPTNRMTNFFEKGDKPLEIVTHASGTSATAAAPTRRGQRQGSA